MALALQQHKYICTNVWNKWCTTKATAMCAFSCQCVCFSIVFKHHYMDTSKAHYLLYPWWHSDLCKDNTSVCVCTHHVVLNSLLVTLFVCLGVKNFVSGKKLLIKWGAGKLKSMQPNFICGSHTTWVLLKDEQYIIKKQYVSSLGKFTSMKDTSCVYTLREDLLIHYSLTILVIG